LHTAGGALEQRAAEFLFERADLPAQYGLSDIGTRRPGRNADAPLAADLPAPLAATGDIAAAAARLLLDRSWTGIGEVPVLGPQDLTPDEMAQTMSEVLDRPVRYRRVTLDDLAAATASSGAGDAFVRGMVDMMRAKDEGLDNGVPRTPQTTTPTTFRQWCTAVLAPAVLA
jgi:uncharacterized protein YbjT (DUF2867 family)